MADLREFYQPLSPKVNFLDPIVRHDPTIGHSVVAKFNSKEKIQSPSNGMNKSSLDATKYEGPRVPIVRVDMMVYKAENIEYVYIDYDGFIPKAKVIINQKEKNMELMQTSNMNSNMTIVMTPSVDGQYKPITIDFYITNTEYYHDCIVFYGTYKLLALDQKITKQITFNPYPDNGCPAKYCNLGPNNHPTTYEFLHYVAVTECGLGFAATDKVKEIKDDKTRIIRNETYKDAIQKHVAFGGLDENSVFDCWIDLYRYLVVVNFSWIMTAKLTGHDIGINPTYGHNWANELMKEDEQFGMQHRIITNYRRMPMNSDMDISSWKWLCDNTKIYENGITNNYTIGNPSSTSKGNNSLKTSILKTKENSIDGDNKNFEFKKEYFCGYEYGDSEDHNTPVLMQKNIHDMMFRKFRSKRLEVKMARPNFGIQRGTLINVAIFEYTEVGKRQIWQQLYGLAGDKDPSPTKTDKDMENIFSDPNTSLLNVSVSGLYYVDGMSFEYDKDNEEVIQRLFLIKRGDISNYLNTNTIAKTYDVNINK